MPARSALGKVVRLPALALLIVAVLAGCSVVQGTISTVSALQEGGYRASQIRTQPGNAFDVTVTRDTEDLDAAARDAARIVWLELPLRIDRLSVVCENGFGGTGRFDGDRAALVAAFGERPAELDAGVDEDEVRKVVILVAVAAVVGLLFLVAIIVTIVLLVRRNRRNRVPPVGYPGHPGGPAPPQAPPPPYPPPP